MQYKRAREDFFGEPSRVSGRVLRDNEPAAYRLGSPM